MQQAEMRRVFNKVDSSKSGSINKDQFELLLMAMGRNASALQIDSYFADLGVSGGGTLSFALFFEWWTSDIGVEFVRTPATGGSHK